MTDQPSTPLTEEQVAALPAGTPVRVLWSGGNGPHKYVVAVDANGVRYANSPEFRDPFYNPLTFIGPEPPFTQVWLSHD